MSYILRPRARTVQPQGPVDIDWSNALTKQLVFAAIPIAGNFFDLVTRTWGTPGGFVATKKVVARAGGYSSQPYAQVLAGDGSVTAPYLWPISDTLRGASMGPNATILALASFNQQVDGKSYIVGGNHEAVSVGAGASLGVDSFIFSGRGLVTKGGFDGSVAAVSGSPGIGNPFDKKLHFFGYGADAVGTEWFYQRTSNTGGAVSFGTTRANRRAAVLGASSGDTSVSTKEANVALALFWDRRLSLPEYQALYDNPWQVFRPQQRRVYVDVAAAPPATTGDGLDGRFIGHRIRPGQGPFAKAWLARNKFPAITDAPIGVMPEAHTAPLEWRKIRPGKGPFLKAWLQSRTQNGSTDGALTPTFVLAGQVTHTYTAKTPQVRASVAPAQATHTYTAQAPKFVGTLKPAQATHTYTAQVPQVRARVQPAQATHTYTGQVPKLQARVAPGAASHTYTGRVPSLSAGALAPPAASHSYTARVPQVKAKVAPAAAAHTYTGQAPQARAQVKPAQATHTYQARAAQVRASVLPAPVTHTYTGRVAQVKARVAPAPAAHSYTGRIPSLFMGFGFTATTATHSYLARTPKLQAKVAPGVVLHTYTSRVPNYVAQIAYTAQPLRARIGATPDVDTHTRIGTTPDVDTDTRIGPASGTVTLKRIGDPAQ